MTALSAGLFWCAMRATIVSLVIAGAYWLLRGRGPAARSTVVCVGLVLLLGVPAMEFSPWPNWGWLRPDLVVTSVSSSDPPSITRPAAMSLPHQGPSRSDSATEFVAVEATATRSLGQLIAEAFWQTMVEPPRAPEGKWQWRDVLAAVCLLLTLAALARLAAGWLAVRSYVRGSVPIGDASVQDELAILQAEMHCSALVELRESSELGTPATVGTLRPIILLPRGWREWSAIETRVVLAHELAHICRCDYAAWILAELSLALHFYHPLVHWLAGRLRLTQELAADAWAARLCGGSRLYLMTLAQMALRQDDRPVRLPARAFLPTRGMFLRRIEMLRTKNVRHAPLGWGTRVLFVGSLTLASLLATGFRLPRPEDPAAANAIGAPSLQPESQPDRADSHKLEYLPADTIAVAVVRPSELLSSPELRQAVDRELDFRSGFGQSIETIEQISLVIRSHSFGNGQPGLVQPAITPVQSMYRGVMLRAKEPTNWQELISRLVPNAEERRYASERYLASPGSGGMSAFRPDERTVIFDLEASLRGFIEAKAQPRQSFPWSESWPAVSRSPVAIAMDVFTLTSRLGLSSTGHVNPIEASLRPLREEVRTVVAGISQKDGLQFNLTALCRSDEGAKKVQGTTEALVTLAGNMLAELKAQTVTAPESQQAIIARLLGYADDMIRSARVEREGSVVRVSASTQRDVAELAHDILPALKFTRLAAQREVGVNNLKQIALALHNYYQAHQAFPPAVLYGPDGKTPYSWRVALLPYIDRSDLYKRYDFNEPWDGPNNRKLLEEIPHVYRSPLAGGDPTHASYYVLVGPATIFSGREGTKLQEISDGSSNTLLVVEANRAAPWTKPEDIRFEVGQPMPSLGGFQRDGFHVAFADGSVRFLAGNVGEALLRAMITKAGAEIVGRQ